MCSHGGRSSACRAPSSAPAVRELESEAPVPIAKQPVLPSVRGILQEVECRDGGQAKLLMQAGQRQIGFLIANPDHVIIRGAPGTKVELTCGKQKPGTTVLIEFEEKANKELGTLGEVRGLEFLK